MKMIYKKPGMKINKILLKKRLKDIKKNTMFN